MSNLKYEKIGYEGQIAYYQEIGHDYIEDVIFDRFKKEISFEDSNKIVKELFEGKYGFTEKIDEAIKAEFKKMISERQ